MGELCPNCGNWTDRLDEETGWCLKCHPDSLICKRCTKPYPEQEQGSYCSSCKEEIFLSTNADRIDEYLRQGISLTRAKRLVADDNRPNCLACNRPIKGGKQGRTNFCKSTPRCRRASRRFRTLRDKFVREQTPNPATIALEQVMRELEDSTDGTTKATSAA